MDRRGIRASPDPAGAGDPGAGAERGSASLIDIVRWQGSEHRDKGRTSKAEPFYHESLELAEMIGCDHGKAHALNCLGSLAQRRGDLNGANTLFQRALALAEGGREPELIGMLQQNLGVIADIRGNVIAAINHYHAGLTTLEKNENSNTTAKILSNLGYLYAKEGRCDEAQVAYSHALRLSRESGDRLCEGIISENQAELAIDCRDIDRAYAAIERALSIADERDDCLRYAAALKLTASCQRTSGDLAGAITTLQQALALSAQSEDAMLAAELLFEFGCATWEVGDANTARCDLTRSLESFERIEARQWVARVRQRLSGDSFGRYC